MFTKYTKQQAYNILKQNADAVYCQLKIKKSDMSPEDVAYLAPEQLPYIKSDQVKVALFMIIETLAQLPIDVDYIIEKIQTGYLFKELDDITL